jgi:hypothetical protein
MKILILVAILTVAAPAFAQDQSTRIAAFDFYGLDGLDVNRVRTALPFREGALLSPGSKAEMVRRVKKAITQATGREVSDVAAVCCDNSGRSIIYIGLRRKPVRQTLYNSAPRGSTGLPSAALKIHREVETAWLNAMKKGVTGEDDSQGYALSLDPETRTKQLALHAYVSRHSPVVMNVLASSRSVEHRQIAAEMLGYADRSPQQIAALIHASRDIDEGVRNNAIRALAVLARSSSEASASIPGECFVSLLNSGVWTDRNKSAELFSILTAQRDPTLLACLREQALTSLIEMARWSYPGHSHGARLILGRIAGIEESSLIAILARQEVEPIINALTTQKSGGENTKRCPVCTALK